MTLKSDINCTLASTRLGNISPATSSVCHLRCHITVWDRELDKFQWLALSQAPPVHWFLLETCQD